MTLGEFVRLAVELREAQKDCEAFASRSALELKARLEKRFDLELLVMVGRFVAEMEPLQGFVALSEPPNGG